MRSILQLRVPEVAGDKDRRSSLKVETLGESSPAVVRFRDPQIEMAHGAGGKASRRLVEGLFAPLLFPGSVEPLSDAAHLEVNGTPIAFTTDSFVVKPLRFPGGSIGELAVNGTMNDLAVSGAKGCAMVVTFVLEEGLATSVLEAEVRAMSEALKRAGVTMCGGDTKVVERGKADGMYITTAGIGSSIARRAKLMRVPCVRATRCCCPARSAITESRYFWRAVTSILKQIYLPTLVRCSLWWKRWPRSAAPGFAGCAIRREAA